MVHFVQQYSDILVDDGNRYVARVYAAPRPNGMWDGWFVFLPLDQGPELAAGCETTQSTLAHVKYWAEGISTVYLQGAFERARASRAEALLGRRAHRAEQEEALARAAAAAYTKAAAAARAAALKARHDRRDAEKQLLAERAAAARAAAVLQAKKAAAARAEATAAEKRSRQSRPPAAASAARHGDAAPGGPAQAPHVPFRRRA
jgi:hypothetical protein